MELLFTLSTLLVLPFWLLMIALPQWRLTKTLMGSPLLMLPLPLLYAVLVVLHGYLLTHLFDTPTLMGLRDILSTSEGALIAWLHLLAVDLFVGRWIYLDSQERGYHPLMVSPAMWATFLAGPIGLILYLNIRSWIEPRDTPEEAADLSGELPLESDAARPAARAPIRGKNN